MEPVQLFKDHEKYVYKICNSIKGNIAKTLGLSCELIEHGKKCVDKQDLYQEGRIWLWEACLTYSKKRHERETYNERVNSLNEIDYKMSEEIKPIASFSTFAYIFLKNRMLNLVKEAKRMKRPKIDLIDGYSESDISGDGWELKQTNVYIDGENIAENCFVLSQIKDKLNEKELEYFYFKYEEGLTNREMIDQNRNEAKYSTIKKLKKFETLQ